MHKTINVLRILLLFKNYSLIFLNIDVNTIPVDNIHNIIDIVLPIVGKSEIMFNTENTIKTNINWNNFPFTLSLYLLKTYSDITDPTTSVDNINVINVNEPYKTAIGIAIIPNPIKVKININININGINIILAKPNIIVDIL